MLTYNLDLEERSTWIRTTPGDFELAQPFWCTEQGDFYAHEGFFTERSEKDSYELFYTFDGRGRLEQDGRAVTLGPGMALLINCRTPQRYLTKPGAERWYHLWAHIDGPGVAAFAETLDVGALRPVTLADPIARRHFGTIATNLGKPGIMASTVVGLAVHNLLAEMVGAAQAVGESALGDEAVRRACALIESAYAKPVTLDDLAKTAQVSKSYLLKLFRQSLGTTPYDYLLRYRITRAKELLAETDYKIGQISALVGFKSESNFSYRFSQMVGQSPRAYRDSCPTPLSKR